ncbi:MAG: hypothetical protein COB24_08610 [Hyphomicrobiales bacterium]|nr:MAG: hypothetical protein COB24_08610 [Hyphomicrobiales bacterium]
MLSYLQFGQRYCNLTQNKQPIVQLLKFVHCSVIFGLFIHGLHLALRQFYLVGLSNNMGFATPFKPPLISAIKGLILVSANPKGGCIRHLSNG